MRCALVLIFATVLLHAQVPRKVCVLDGAHDARVIHEGVLDAAESDGHWALRCGPATGTRYYGFTLRDLWGATPKALLLRVFLEGSAGQEFQLRIEDDEGMRSNDAAAWLDQPLLPGWNELRVDLNKLTSRVGARALDCSAGLRRIRLSRRADAGSAALRIEFVAFEGETLASAAATAVEQALALPHNNQRERALCKLLAGAAPAKAAELAVAWMARANDEQARAVARDALQHNDDPKCVQLLLQRAARTAPERVDFLHVLASHPDAGAHSAALKALGEKKLLVEEQVALVRGLARVGRWNPALVPIAPEGAAWPLRAALMESALHANCDDSMSAVISCTGVKEAARVHGPAIAALKARLGTDLGHDRAAWTELWNTRRNQPAGVAQSSQGAAYGSFYGIPMDPGRVVFVIDGSGSMRAEIKGGKASVHIRESEHLKGQELRSRLDLLKAELLHVLAKLPSGTHVGIVFFNDEALWLSKGLEPLNDDSRERLAARVRAVNPGQATNIHDGMWAAFHPAGKVAADDALAGPDTIVVLTDGAPSAGPVKDPEVLADAILRWNIGRAIRIHSVNVGDRYSRWMQRVSVGSGGVHQDLSSDRSTEGAR